MANIVYPIVAICVALISFEFARNLRRKGKSIWYIPAAISLTIVIGMVLWWMNRGNSDI